MRAGSLVCYTGAPIESPFLQQLDKEAVYTIRAIFIRKSSRARQVYLEETQGKLAGDGIEAGYLASKFRELQSPDEVSIEHIMSDEIAFVNP